MEEEIEINGKKYVLADSVRERQKVELGKYVIVRSKAGVFAGHMKEKNGAEVVLNSARRLWYWKGAASLSQLAQSGLTCPNECKFPEEVDEIVLPEVIEILSVTDKAMKIIKDVPIWKMK